MDDRTAHRVERMLSRAQEMASEATLVLEEEAEESETLGLAQALEEDAENTRLTHVAEANLGERPSPARQKVREAVARRRGASQG